MNKIYEATIPDGIYFRFNNNFSFGYDSKTKQWIIINGMTYFNILGE